MLTHETKPRERPAHVREVPDTEPGALVLGTCVRCARRPAVNVREGLPTCHPCSADLNDPFA